MIISQDTNTLSHILKWFEAVILNRSSESHMWLPSTLCGALCKLSIAPLIFSVIDFALQ